MKIIILICLMLWAVSVNAELIDNGDNTITQIRNDGSQLMWYKEVRNNSISSSWDLAMLYADNFRHSVFTNWRLPSSFNFDGSGPCRGFNCTESELGYLYYIELGNTADYQNSTPSYGPFDRSCELFSGTMCYSFVWTSTIDESISTYIYAYNFFSHYGGFQGSTKTEYGGELWLVRDVAVVPEPISTLLFIVGGTLMAGSRFTNRAK